MDEQLRQNAKSTIEAAEKLKKNRFPIKLTLDKYSEGINLYLQILNKNSDDLIAISDIYHETATIYFNKNDYSKAALNYAYSIQHLQQIVANDTVYRKLTTRYIDLADAYYELLNHPAGNEAMTNAIKAFQLIQEKDEKELAIGDPVTNFKKFHNYYERQLSDSSYTSTVQFMNHQQLLGDVQQDNILLSQFDSISIGEMKQLDDSLEAMLAHLSVSDGPKAPTFFNPEPGDRDYRNTAADFLRMAKSHLKKGAIESSLITYMQAIKALQLMRNPNELDHQLVRSLTEQIAFLKAKLYQPKSSFSAADLIRYESDEEMDESEMNENVPNDACH